MRGLTDRLRVFNTKYGRPVRPRPTADLGHAEVAQFLGKLDEELAELRQAIDNRALTATADALADIIYVTGGIALQFGIDIDLVLDLVHKSNMTKEVSDDGELIKGESYREPPLEAALESMSLLKRRNATTSDR